MLVTQDAPERAAQQEADQQLTGLEDKLLSSNPDDELIDENGVVEPDDSEEIEAEGADDEDVGEPDDDSQEAVEAQATTAPPPPVAQTEEMQRLREELAELRGRVSAQPQPQQQRQPPTAQQIFQEGLRAVEDPNQVREVIRQRLPALNPDDPKDIVYAQGLIRSHLQEQYFNARVEELDRRDQEYRAQMREQQLRSQISTPYAEQVGDALQGNAKQLVEYYAAHYIAHGLKPADAVKEAIRYGGYEPLVEAAKKAKAAPAPKRKVVTQADAAQAVTGSPGGAPPKRAPRTRKQINHNLSKIEGMLSDPKIPYN